MLRNGAIPSGATGRGVKDPDAGLSRCDSSSQARRRRKHPDTGIVSESDVYSKLHFCDTLVESVFTR